MIYTTGTVSTVSGAAIVSGTGTKWTVNNPKMEVTDFLNGRLD